MNISFFIENPSGPGIIVDNAVMFGIQPREYFELSQYERAFVSWYVNDFNTNGLEVLRLQVETNNDFDPTLDIPQETICKIFMENIYSQAFS
jgi:hypothetical protein